MKTRLNPVTGQEEFWNQPPGLPGIWMTRGLCSRCKPYQHCLGLMEMTDEEWKQAEESIQSITDHGAFLRQPLEPGLRTGLCKV